MTNTRPRERYERRDDVEYARRGVATFGGGTGSGVGDTLREFVRRYGWRAYALPVLVVITVVALFTTGGGGAHPTKAVAQQQTQSQSSSTGSSSPPVAPNTIPLKSDSAQGAALQEALKNSALPPGASYTRAGAGTFRVVPGTTKPVGTAGGTLYRYDVEVERGITGVSVDQFAALVQSTLANPKSWSGHGVRVQRVDASSSETPDFHVSLTSAFTVRQLCGYQIHIETSCYAKAGQVPGLTVNRVVLNVARWVRGARPYISDLAAYRIYMINHEDGHAMGHNHAHQCLPGGLAPVMMQQTFGLKSATTGKYCQANPWPYPPGVSGAPGAEQQDTRANDEYYIGD